MLRRAPATVCRSSGGWRRTASRRSQGGDEVGGVRGEHGEQPGQVGAVPVAGQVGLAEPDQARRAEPAEELAGPVNVHDRGRRSPAAVQPPANQPPANQPPVNQPPVNQHCRPPGEPAPEAAPPPCRTQRGPRMPDDGREQRPRRGRDGPAPHAGGETMPVRPIKPHAQREGGVRLGQAHPVAAVDRVEGRDVELLRHLGAAPVVGTEQVGVPLAVGVMHLGHHAGERAVGPVAPVHAQRVEHVPEHARLGQHRHPPPAQVDVARGQEAIEVGPDAGPRVPEVVTGEEAGQPRDPGQLVEVDQPQVAAVAEHVAQRGRTGVADRDLIDLRAHHAPPRARAAAAPDRQPSSWKPQR